MVALPLPAQPPLSLREYRHLLESCILRQSEQQVHVLHGLSGCSFYHIVDSTHHNNTFGSRIQLKGYIRKVAALYPAGLRRKSRLQNAYKVFILIILIVDGLYLFRGHILYQRCVSSYQNAAVHRNQMRGKADGNFRKGIMGERELPDLFRKRPKKAKKNVVEEGKADE